MEEWITGSYANLSAILRCGNVGSQKSPRDGIARGNFLDPSQRFHAEL